jgi:hypothetical protein
MFKTVGLQVRKDGLTHDQYVDHWLNVHAPMSEGVEGLRGYVSNEVLAAGPAVDVGATHPDFGAPLDGVASLHFDTSDGIARMAEAPKVQEWFSDGPNFVGLRTGFVVEEHVIRSPGEGGARLSFKAICFVKGGLAAVEAIDAQAAGLTGGLVRSRVEAITGSTNLPGFEVPEIDHVVELWATGIDGARAAARALREALGTAGDLVGAVLVRERVLRQPAQ